MQGESFISDDPGTVLESYVGPAQALQRGIAASGMAASPVAAARPGPAALAEGADRSPYRWTAPRLLICEDGTLEQGELVYVRAEKIVIGRTKGDVVIGHDVAMSASHAEIARLDCGGKHAWVLRDLGSSNGTLARVRSVTLKPGLVLQLGSRRYRFEPAAFATTAAQHAAEPRTVMLSDPQNVPVDALPALVDSTGDGKPPAVRMPFRSTRLTIGRPGQGNDLEIDDLCLARTHAVVSRDASGMWQLEAQPSINGVWVKIEAIRLTDQCHFQCGEQRFRFQA